MKLGVNVDHVATLRNLRGTPYPCIVTAARTAISSGASFVTVHLREDRRHVTDIDLANLTSAQGIPINLEMATTQEMLSIAIQTKPQAVCLVPEKRQEVTTEHGLDAVGSAPYLRGYIEKLQGEGIDVTLFLDPIEEQIEQAVELRANTVELHVGEYSRTRSRDAYSRIISAVQICTTNQIQCHAGHGIDYYIASRLSTIQGISCINVGHFLVCEALKCGLDQAIRRMLSVISR